MPPRASFPHTGFPCSHIYLDDSEDAETTLFLRSLLLIGNVRIFSHRFSPEQNRQVTLKVQKIQVAARALLSHKGQLEDRHKDSPIIGLKTTTNAVPVTISPTQRSSDYTVHVLSSCLEHPARNTASPDRACPSSSHCRMSL